MNRSRESKPRVTVAIATWNSAEYLPACLEVVANQTYPNLNLIVIDNGSTDGSPELVRDLAPAASLIRNESNEGYSAAHNHAIGVTDGPYYLSLNPDVELDADYIRLLVDAMENRPDFGSAVGKLWLPGRTKDGTRVLDASGMFIDRQRHQYLRGHGKTDSGQFDKAEEVFGVDGAAPLYRRSMLDDLHMLDEVFDHNFFAYMEDIDLAWRARILGWKAWYEPQATGVHDRTFRPGRRRNIPREIRRLAVKNRYLMLLKNESGAPWRRDWWRVLAYDFGIWMYVLLLEQTSLGSLPLLSKQWRDAMNWRRVISEKAKVSSDGRLGWFR